MPDQALPFSQASENNKLPILEIFKQTLGGYESLLEIGGGTGQHAVFFAEQFPQLHWQSSDIASNVASLNLRIEQASLPNLPSAMAIDANDSTWSCGEYDAVFTANSLHIMSAQSVENLFRKVAAHIAAQGVLLVYGPFKYNGNFTTQSNARFDLWLKERDPLSGIRDFEWVNELAQSAGLSLQQDHGMPANNQLLVWRKTSA